VVEITHRPMEVTLHEVEEEVEEDEEDEEEDDLSKYKGIGWDEL